MELDILLLNRIKKSFTNKDTGEVTPMILITYGINMEDEFSKGYAILECYSKDNSLDIIDKYLGKRVKAEIRMIPQSNGFKYSLISLNNEKIR